MRVLPGYVFSGVERRVSRETSFFHQIQRPKIGEHVDQLRTVWTQNARAGGTTPIKP